MLNGRSQANVLYGVISIQVRIASGVAMWSISGRSVRMWSRTSATTRSSSSSRMTYPHSQITWLATGCPFPPTFVGPEVHQVLLGKLFPRQADVTTVAEWAAGLRRRRPVRPGPPPGARASLCA
jgi:hypothetical protein